jgi:hypothetical protein
MCAKFPKGKVKNESKFSCVLISNQQLIGWYISVGKILSPAMNNFNAKD